MSKVKDTLVAGLATILPLGLTVLILWFLVVKIGNLLRILVLRIPYINQMPELVISLVGFIIVILIIYIMGVITSSYVGRTFTSLGDKLLSRMPIIAPIYNAAKQLVNAIFTNRTAFKRVVFVEYPRKGLYTLGFITNERGIKVQGTECISVFVPTTPNPTSGFYLAVPPDQVIYTNLSIDEAFKIIVSGGILTP